MLSEQWLNSATRDELIAKIKMVWESRDHQYDRCERMDERLEAVRHVLDDAKPPSVKLHCIRMALRGEYDKDFEKKDYCCISEEENHDQLTEMGAYFCPFCGAVRKEAK